MKINYQRNKYLEGQKAMTKERIFRIVTDYNGGISAKDIAKRENVTVAWIYILLKRARTEIIN